jgi:alpha-L-fucosidase
MLNIGPRANGDVPYEISQRLLNMGKWLEVNGASIYGCGAFDLPKDQHDWGHITCKVTNDGTHRLFLHVYNWPLSGQLPVTGINTKPKNVYLLSDKQKAPLPFKHNQMFTEITLPHLQPDNFASVVVMEFDHKPEITRELVAKNIDNGFSLTPRNAMSEKGDFTKEPSQKYGTIPPHVEVSGTYKSQWKVFIDQPGQYRLDASYSYQGETSDGKIEIKAGNEVLKNSFSPTGMTVGEPNEDWHIEKFVANKTGTINFPEPGVYDISVKIEAGKEPVKFQWFWMEKK